MARGYGRGDGRAENGREESGAHIPVLRREVLEALAPRPDSQILDGTVGLGGHAEAILGRLGSGGVLVGIDRDAEALEKAEARLAGVCPGDSRFFLFRGLFTQAREVLQAAGIQVEGGLDGILLDLGVSSAQLDAPQRGFSFLRDGPLDMRMSASGEGASDLTAARWLEKASRQEIEQVLRRYGEEPAAARIARAIDRQRRVQPIRTTLELARIVEAEKPRRGARIHPATQTFQALRIQVNAELSLLEAFLAQADRFLAPRGKLAVISYHSLEDRLVKRLIQKRVKEGIFEQRGPDFIRPSEAEIKSNPRARSAHLRWAMRRG
ncbi:MAG: 16S rRNA (cytosine(1402)-N(4))-methyltransferase RsmH [Planctomycetes bacterium]|nr:16S rRNA (cytosine(1402)-N(4))-methyltransferase RsmH [Planctomycetota bacterium]